MVMVMMIMKTALSFTHWHALETRSSAGTVCSALSELHAWIESSDFAMPSAGSNLRHCRQLTTHTTLCFCGEEAVCFVTS